MNVTSVLTKDTVVLGLEADRKEAAITELINVLAASGKVKDRDTALRIVMERERKMSTGLQDGIAIPHGKCDCVDNVVAAVGIKREGLAFESLDGQPARIIVLTLSPLNKPGPHIQFLAAIGKALSSPAVRERLLSATESSEVVAAITESAAATVH